jgi:NAD(P)-dependent dehydrogenase (short-subunit alcohol dehydrogenase family)
MRLSGRIALITGASRGIGKSVALAFAREGAGIFLVGHHDESALQQTLQETRALGAEAEGGLFDVGNYEDVRRLTSAIERRFATLDIVVNNAGVIRPTPLKRRCRSDAF